TILLVDLIAVGGISTPARIFSRRFWLRFAFSSRCQTNTAETKIVRKEIKSSIQSTMPPPTQSPQQFERDCLEDCAPPFSGLHRTWAGCRSPETFRSRAHWRARPFAQTGK